MIRRDASCEGFCPRCRSLKARRAKHPHGLSIRPRRNIPLYRNSDLSYVSSIPAWPWGAIMCRHFSRAGLRWTRQRRHDMARAGRVVPVSPKPRADERRWKFVSPAFFRLRRQGRRTLRRSANARTAKPCGPGRRCYGQAFRGGAREPNRADGIVNSRGEGGQKELGSRESTA